MSNLLKDYALEISTKHWNNLCDAFYSNEAVLRENIKNEKGPRKKENADTAINLLSSALKNRASQHLLKTA